MITDPMAIFAVCAGICALVFWSTEQSWAKKFYKIIPSIALIYYIPTFATTFGILPSSSPVYVWMKDYLLPFSLFILMITTDLPTILKIGPKALAMMAIGTLGVVVGGPVALLIFKQWVPPDTWKGLAALSGSWIGGGANFAAIKESVGAPDSIIGPIIIVDTAVGYTWMGVLLFLANHQKGIDRWNKADTRVLEDLNRRLKDFQKNQMKPISLPDASAIIAIGILGAVVCQFLAGIVFDITDPFFKEYLPTVATIFSKFTWTVILISTIGILLSFTPLKKIEGSGASKLGYAALYLFLTSIGAKADLAGIAAAPILLAVGAVWIIIHVSFLIIGARLLRAPLFLLAVLH